MNESGRTVGDVLFAIGAFINANKTKLLGASIALISFFQVNPSLKNLLSDSQYELSMLALGSLAILFGYLNNPEK